MSNPEVQTKEFDFANSDYYLTELIHRITGTEFEIPVTLYIKGSIITGMLSSGHRFFDDAKSKFVKLFSGIEDVEIIATNLTSYGDVYRDLDPERELEKIHYVHLRDAKTYGKGNEPIPANGSWWRGLIKSIDGFNIGTLAETKSNK